MKKALLCLISSLSLTPWAGFETVTCVASGRLLAQGSNSSLSFSLVPCSLALFASHASLEGQAQPASPTPHTYAVTSLCACQLGWSLFVVAWEHVPAPFFLPPVSCSFNELFFALLLWLHCLSWNHRGFPLWLEPILSCTGSGNSPVQH